MNSTNSSSSPHKLSRLLAAGALAAAALGGLLYRLTGVDAAAVLPEAALCPFKKLTSLPCPGCGMTHAFLALGRLDFSAAFAFNLLSFPLAALLFLHAAGKIPRRFHEAKVTHYALFAVLVFWQMRLLRCL